MWTGPEQRQPAAGPHYAQHHDQPGSSHTPGPQRMPHLFRVGSACSLLPLPAQRGLWRWVRLWVGVTFIIVIKTWGPSLKSYSTLVRTMTSQGYMYSTFIIRLTFIHVQSLHNVLIFWPFWYLKYLKSSACVSRVRPSNEEMHQMPSHNHQED